MFGFLKEKLKKAVEKITKKVEKEAEEIEIPAPPQEEKKAKEEKKPEKKEVKKKAEPKEEKKEEKKAEEKKGFFAKFKEKIATKKIDSEKFEELFWELETILLENNVAVEVIDKIKDDLKKKLVDVPIKRSDIEGQIEESLKESLTEVLSVEQIDLLEKIKEKKPFVICFLGINGSGKTSTIAKVAKLLQDNGKTVVMAAADTFRAAAIEQLQQHADKLGVKMIKHDYKSDSAAVAFDAVKHAEAQKKDVVLIDTAGRLHSNKDLLDELKKIVRVAKPDMKIFVGESITGNDCVEQAKEFNAAVGIDAIILAKADIDEKGGAALSVSYVTKKPIIYLGTGQAYKDLEAFDKEKILKNLGF